MNIVVEIEVNQACETTKLLTALCEKHKNPLVNILLHDLKDKFIFAMTEQLTEKQIEKLINHHKI